MPGAPGKMPGNFFRSVFSDSASPFGNSRMFRLSRVRLTRMGVYVLSVNCVTDISYRHGLEACTAGSPGPPLAGSPSYCQERTIWPAAHRLGVLYSTVIAIV